MKNARLIEIFRSQNAHWQQTIDMMKAGDMTVIENRKGQRVDVTRETIAEREGLIARNEELIAELEAASAKRP